MDLSIYKATPSKPLASYPTIPLKAVDEKTAKKALKRSRKALAAFQEKMYAHDKYAVLVCIQGMDTAGKDSLIREVFEDFNVRGVKQHSFKTPTPKELSHGYLWRHYIALPSKGSFGIFNRTHYENVLVTRVHPEYILNENLPTISTVDDIDEDFWKMRFEQINNFEKELSQNGTVIFKFFLNLSKEEQKNRLLRRLELPEKNWKFSPGDLKERALWPQYMNAYEQAIQHTTTDHAPWHILPADDKPMARLIACEIMRKQLEKMEDVQFPQLDPEVVANLETFKTILKDE